MSRHFFPALLLLALLTSCSDFKTLRSRENTIFELRNPPVRIKGVLNEVLRESIVIHEGVSDAALEDTINWARIERVTFVNGNKNRGVGIGIAAASGFVLGCGTGCIYGIVSENDPGINVVYPAAGAGLAGAAVAGGGAYLVSQDKTVEIGHPQDLEELKPFAGRQR